MKNNDLRGLLAEARAIYFTMQYGEITYEQAKVLIKPILIRINKEIKLIANEYKVQPKFVKFQDLGRNL